jgi:ribosomal protein L23
VATLQDLEEQTKLVNSFLKLAYWYWFFETNPKKLRKSIAKAILFWYNIKVKNIHIESACF